MHPLDCTHYIDRTDMSGGDNRYAVPIASCAEGTLWAEMAPGHTRVVERMPLSEMTKETFNHGNGFRFIREWAANGTWDNTHHPRVVLREGRVPAIPLFIDGGIREVVRGVLLEGSEQAGFPVVDGSRVQYPRVSYDALDLITGQTGLTRRDQPHPGGNSGDSGLPRFVQLSSGRIAFLGEEIGSRGTGSNAILYRDLLAEAKKEYPDITWAEVGPEAIIGVFEEKEEEAVTVVKIETRTTVYLSNGTTQEFTS